MDVARGLNELAGGEVRRADGGGAVRRARVAVTAVFVVHGLLFASWTAHIPDVKAHLGLTDGTLGFALLGAPVGSVTAMIAASWLLPRIGSRRVVQVALVGYCAAGPLVGLTGSLAGLLGALFIWGAFQGTLDVAMNTQAIAVERARGRLLMSGLHGSWSIGSFAGAGIGALAVAAGRAGPAAPAHRVPRRRYPQLARTPCPCPRRMKAAITRSYAGGCHTHPGKMWFREC